MEKLTNESIQKLHELASSNDVNAQMQLGEYYLQLGDTDLSKLWFRKAAHQYFFSNQFDKLIDLYSGPLFDPGKRLFYEVQKIRDNQENYDNLCLLQYVLKEEKFDFNNILSAYKDYYTGIFLSDLQTYYVLQNKFAGRNINFSISCESKESPCERLPNFSTKKYYFFSLAVYFTSLFPQVLGHLYGKDIMYDFFVCTGWPLLNCGMAAMMSPIEILRESKLLPSQTCVINYLFIFEHIKEYMLNEFIKFLDGDQPNLSDSSYGNIVKKVAERGNRREVKDECFVQFEIFKLWLVNPTMETNKYLVTDL